MIIREQTNNGFRANPGLINKQAAYAAHAGTSFEPEKRGEQEIRGFADEVQAVYERLKPNARTDAEKALLISEMERFQASYAQKYNDLLYSHSRIYSTMIAGPSGFPAERMRKINEAYDKKAHETYEWKDRAEKAMLRALKGLATEEAGGEVAVLKNKIAQAEKLQEMMVEANKIIRKKAEPGIGGISKYQQLINIGFTERQATEAMTPDYMRRTGFPAFALTNNSANIRRMKERLIELEKREVTPTAEITFPGGSIVDNREEDRVQIFFDQKPPQAMIDKLKGEGWRWAPSVGAWSRKRTDAAMYSARRITGAVPPAVQPQVAPAPMPPTTTPINNINSLAKLRASEWFKAQVSNPYERYYLYHRVGDFMVSNIDPQGYTLSNPERISPAWAVEQATQWIINIAQRLPILPLDIVPAATPAAPPVTAPQPYALPELKWVYGTRDEKWHLVGPEDRDYAQGITQERMKIIGPQLAKAEYLSPSLARAAAPAPQAPAAAVNVPWPTEKSTDVKAVQSIHEIKQQVLDSIQTARSVEELQAVLKGIGFLPLPEPEKRQVMDAYQNRYSILMAERPFGAPMKTEEETPRVLGAPTPQQRFEEEQRKKSAESAFRGQQKLTSGASVTKRLSEFGIKERMLPEMTSSMREYIGGAVPVKDVIHHYRDCRPPTRGVLYRARDKTYFVEADGQFYASIGWEDVTGVGMIREPVASYAAERGY